MPAKKAPAPEPPSEALKRQAQEKDNAIANTRSQKNQLEERIRDLEEILEGLNTCGPDLALRRVATTVALARARRQAYTPQLEGHPLAALGAEIEAHVDRHLPSSAALNLRDAWDSFEAAQGALNSLRDSIIAASSSPQHHIQQNPPPPPPEQHVQILVDQRDAARRHLVEMMQAFVAGAQQDKVEELREELGGEYLPRVRALLGMFGPPAPGLAPSRDKLQASDAIQQYKDVLVRFRAEQQAAAHAWAQATDDAQAQLEAAMRQSADRLGVAIEGFGDESSDDEQSAELVEGEEPAPTEQKPAKQLPPSLNQLLQIAEAIALAEITWLRAHRERCHALWDTTVSAGFALHDLLQLTLSEADSMALLSAECERYLPEWVSLERPAITHLRDIDSKLRNYKREAITARAHRDTTALGRDRGALTEAEGALSACLKSVQHSQVAYEYELQKLSAMALTHFPELALLFPHDVDINSTAGLASVDGLLRPGRKFEDYVEEQRITHGHHIVVVASYADRQCALKEYNAPPGRGDNLMAEVLILSRLRHPNIMPIECVIQEPRSMRSYIQMPYFLAGTMAQWMGECRPSLEVIRCVVAQVLQGMSHMHYHMVVHCDIKLENVLVIYEGPQSKDAAPRAVLSDFDISLDGQARTMVPSTVVGGGCTFVYAAPEIRRGEAATTASDVWSFGVVLHLAYFNREWPQFRAGMTTTFVAPDRHEVERYELLVALLERIFQEEPSNRPTAEQVLWDPFFEDSTEELRTQRTLRASAAEVVGEWTALQPSVQTTLETRAALQQRLSELHAALFQTRQELEQLDTEQRETLELHESRKRIRMVATREALEQRWSETLAGLEQVAEGMRQTADSHRSLLQEIRRLESKLQVLQQQLAQQRVGRLAQMYWHWVEDCFGVQLVSVSEPSARESDCLTWLEHLMRGTWAEGAFQIERAERVEHVAAWRAYSTQRFFLHLQMQQAQQLAGDLLGQDAVNCTTDCDWLVDLGAEQHVNEKLLFLAVPSRQAALNLRHADSMWLRRDGPCGRGIYFTEAADVADHVAEVQPDGTKCIVAARVCLGFPYYANLAAGNQPTPSWPAAPRIGEANQLDPYLQPRYHSVVDGDPMPGKRSFVIFRGEQFYPEFIITYRRLSPPTPEPEDFEQPQQQDTAIPQEVPVEEPVYQVVEAVYEESPEPQQTAEATQWGNNETGQSTDEFPESHGDFVDGTPALTPEPEVDHSATGTDHVSEAQQEQGSPTEVVPEPAQQAEPLAEAAEEAVQAERPQEATPQVDRTEAAPEAPVETEQPAPAAPVAPVAPAAPPASAAAAPAGLPAGMDPAMLAELLRKKKEIEDMLSQMSGGLPAQ